MSRSGALLQELEKDVQRKVYELLVKCGCAVYWLSQARETQQTRGVPDLIVFSPLRGFAFVECKRDGGKQSAEQKAFQAACARHGVVYILGGVEDVAYWLGRKDAAWAISLLYGGSEMNQRAFPAVLGVRLSRAQRQTIEAIAQAEKLTPSAWARRILVRAAEHEMRQKSRARVAITQKEGA